MARGKASADASELEKIEWPHAWLPPWRNDRLVGHDLAERTMLVAQQMGRLQHAWLLTGPRGIGKATLAWRFARFLLAGQEGGLFATSPDSLGIDMHAPGRSLVDARTHPDLFTCAGRSIRYRPHARRDRREDVRISAASCTTPAMGKWRVAIVDWPTR